MLAVAASTVACAAVLGFERLSEDAVPETGAPDAAGEAGLEAGPLCSDLGVPAKPAAATGDGSAGPGPFTVAVSLLDLGIDPTAPPVGLNLDGVCSHDVATSSCATAVTEDLWGGYGDDKDGGLDNAGLSLLGSNSGLGEAFSPAEINRRLQQGGYGLVLRISSYNGLSNDDAVEVDFFPALGVQQAVDGGGYGTGMLNDAGVLSFASTDKWTLDQRFAALGSSGSTLRSRVGYVADGRLVAKFDNVILPISVPGDPKRFDIVLNGFYVSADLSFKSGAWSLSNGVFAGRWKTSQFLEQLRAVYIKDSLGLKDAGLCEPAGRPLYEIVKGAICTARDIRSDQQGVTSLPCDAFSTGLRFETYAIDQLGPIDAGPAIAARCPAVDGGVPANDDCAPASP
jgi:hypothetical protein